MTKLWEVRISDRGLALAKAEQERFHSNKPIDRPYDRDNVADEDPQREYAGFLAELAFKVPCPAALYGRENYWDYKLHNYPLDIKNNLNDHNPARMNLHQIVNANYNKPTFGAYVFSYVPKNFSIVRFAGWLPFEEFYRVATFRKAGTEYQRGNRMFRNKLDTYEISMRQTRPMVELEAFALEQLKEKAPGFPGALLF